MIKKKNKWKKGVGLRETTPRDEDILDEGDFVMDGYSVQIPDDYELQQEEVTNGMESNDAEPIAVDRYLRRIR